MENQLHPDPAKWSPASTPAGQPITPCEYIAPYTTRRPCRRVQNAHPTARGRIYRIISRPGTVHGGFLAPERRQDHNQSRSGESLDDGRSAGPAIQSLSCAAGLRTGGKHRRAREGTDRSRLRRTLLLGHGNLCIAVFDLHCAAHRQKSVEVPARDVGQSARTGAPAQSARGHVSLEDDQRRRSVGILRGGHRAVSHQRRHHVRVEEVHPGDGRGRIPLRRRR